MALRPSFSNNCVNPVDVISPGSPSRSNNDVNPVNAILPLPGCVPRSTSTAVLSVSPSRPNKLPKPVREFFPRPPFSRSTFASSRPSFHRADPWS